MSKVERIVVLCFAVGLGGCSFIDNFGSFSVATEDASVADLGPVDGGDAIDLASDAGAPIDLGTVDAGTPDAGPIGRVVDIVSGPGASHTCAVFDSGRVRCWGYGGFGELGNGEVIDGMGTSQATPQDVVALPGRVLALTVGAHHTCAIVVEASSYGLFCWGDGSEGQHGNGLTESYVSTPRRIDAPWQPRAVAAGGAFTCVLTTTNQVLCAGDNPDQQLGSPNPPTTDSLTFRATDFNLAPRMADGLFAGSRNVCITTMGVSACWGDNDSEQLGVASPSDSALAIDLTGAVSVAIGGFHICALQSDGVIRCSGYGNFGQLGNGAEPLSSTGVVAMAGYANAVVAGDSHTCAILEDAAGDDVYCWGKNDAGEIGQPSGAMDRVSVPTQVDGVTNVVKLASGSDHVCALTMSSDVYCWGSNGELQLGPVATGGSSPTPFRVTGLD